jgi:hypothetical protein
METEWREMWGFFQISALAGFPETVISLSEQRSKIKDPEPLLKDPTLRISTPSDGWGSSGSFLPCVDYIPA